MKINNAAFKILYPSILHFSFIICLFSCKKDLTAAPGCHCTFEDWGRKDLSGCWILTAYKAISMSGDTIWVQVDKNKGEIVHFISGGYIIPLQRSFMSTFGEYEGYTSDSLGYFVYHIGYPPVRSFEGVFLRQVNTNFLLVHIQEVDDYYDELYMRYYQ
jgi:hypothetical protein